MRPFVIYTAIVGHYDDIQQPEAVDDDFDYVLFSNDIDSSKVGVWQVRNIPYEDVDVTRVARWVKTHPEQLLPGYEASVWMDGNIAIQTKEVYARVRELFQKGVLVSAMWHNACRSILDEAAELALIGWERERVCLDWQHQLWKEHYALNNSHWETNVLFRVHSNDRVKSLDELWWDCIAHYSRRDQLSFPYTLWRTGVECPYCLSDHENARNSSLFKYVKHDSGKDKGLPIEKNTLVYWYKKKYGPSERDRLARWYRKIAVFPHPHRLAYLLGQYLRLKTRLSF